MTLRKRLPPRRKGWTQNVYIGGHKFLIGTGEYEDGSLGEIFVNMHKEGAAFRSVMNAFAISVSLGLQYGIPLDAYIKLFVGMKFEPNGPVIGHPQIKSARSVIDFIFRLLGAEYLGREDLVSMGDE